MHTSKVEIAFWRYIRDIGRQPSLFTQFPNLRTCLRIVDRSQNHSYPIVIEIGGLEFLIEVFHLLAQHAMLDFGVQTIVRAYYGDSRVGIEEVKYAACGDLSWVLMLTA